MKSVGAAILGILTHTVLLFLVFIGTAQFGEDSWPVLLFLAGGAVALAVGAATAAFAARLEASVPAMLLYAPVALLEIWYAVAVASSLASLS